MRQVPKCAWLVAVAGGVCRAALAGGREAVLLARWEDDGGGNREDV